MCLKWINDMDNTNILKFQFFYYKNNRTIIKKVF